MPNDTNTTDISEDKRRSVLQVVEDALQTLELDVKTGSCADFARLLQLQRELRKEEDIENIRKIEVTWVDPFQQTECCTEK